MKAFQILHFDFTYKKSQCVYNTLAVGAGGGCMAIFNLIFPFSPLSPSLWETARYRLKYCLKGPLNPKQSINHVQYTPVNHPALLISSFHNNKALGNMALLLCIAY